MILETVFLCMSVNPHICQFCMYWAEILPVIRQAPVIHATVLHLIDHMNGYLVIDSGGYFCIINLEH